MEKEKRIYFAKVAIVGQSGTGKSYLTKTADKSTTGFINFERKPLPYKGEPFKFEGRPSTWAGFIKNFDDYVKNEEVKTIVLDSFTMALNTLIKEMSSKYSGFDIYKFYNKNVYEFMEAMKNAPKDILVLAHDEIAKDGDGEKVKRMATHGKEFDGKLEQHFTIVLYTGSEYKDGRPNYFLKTFEPHTSAKTPEGMFPDKEGNTLLRITNDANYLFEELENYYTL